MNDAKYITVKVEKGDSLYKLANKYNTTTLKIKQINNLTSDTIYPNQYLLIPNQLMNVNQTYVTNDGDTLEDIMIRFNLSKNDLLQKVDILKLKLKAGNELCMNSLEQKEPTTNSLKSIEYLNLKSRHQV